MAGAGTVSGVKLRAARERAVGSCFDSVWEGGVTGRRRETLLLPPPKAANFSSVFFLLLLVTWLVNAKNCGSHAVRRPLPRFLLLAFYTPITGLRSSVGVSLQLLVCSDAQRCLIFDEALFINQPPPLPPVATWQIFIGKTSRKTRRSWEAVHQNAHALFFCFSFTKRTPTFTVLLIVVRCSPELESVKLIFLISGDHSCFSPFLYFFLSFCFSPGSFLFVLLLWSAVLFSAAPCWLSSRACKSVLLSGPCVTSSWPLPQLKSVDRLLSHFISRVSSLCSAIFLPFRSDILFHFQCFPKTGIIF